MTKRTKAVARYRKANSSRKCRNCVSMHPDGTCAKVEGTVQPTYVCDLWTLRSPRLRSRSPA